MFKQLQVAATLLCTLSYSAAATNSIGLASARGDMRVDNYLVKGNATLFDGSVIETGQASANLHLNKGAEITLSTESRGTLYSDRLVLQQGKTEVAGTGTFRLEANGLRVTPHEANSHGVISVSSDKTVEVASLNGSFEVINGQGIVLANVMQGRVVSFAMQAGANAASFYGAGLVSFENGTYYLTTSENAKYILSCTDPHKFVGNKVIVSGTFQAASGPTGGSTSMLCVKSMSVNGGGGGGVSKKWLIGGLVVAAGAGTAIGILGSNGSGKSASR